MKIIPIKLGSGPICREHAYHANQSGDFSAQSNPPAIWYFELAGHGLYLCDACKNILHRISGSSGG